MIITESQLRNIVKKILLEATEKFEDYIKDRPAGDAFRGWVNKNHADVAKKIDLDSTGDHTNSYIKSAWDELGDEYAKIKKDEDQKKKNLSTDGKYRFLKGSNPDGTYPAKPDRGLTKPYLKFIKDEQVFALDPTEPDPKKALKQAERGSGKGKKIEFVSESQKALFERVLKRRIVENYVNPAKVYMDLKKGRVDDPGGVFAKNKEKIVKIADKGVKSQSLGSDIKAKKSKGFKASRHEFYNESKLPIKFEQLDMSECAETAMSLLGEWGGLTEKTGFEFLYNKICKPVHDAFGGSWQGLKKWVKNASNDVPDHAWSSWFLNRCLISNSELRKMTQPFQNGYEARGVAYPWSVGNKNRLSVVNDMEKSIGTTKLMMFSREEIENRSDLDFKPGVFTLNAYKGSSDSFETIKKRTKHGSGLHMNVLTSQGPIGGNRGSKGVINNKGSIKGYNCYYILVKVVPNKPALA